MMGAAAPGAAPDQGTPSTPEPASTGAPAAPQAAPEPSKGDGQGSGQGQAQDGAQSPPEPKVTWEMFREARTRGTQLQQQLRSAEEKFQRDLAEAKKAAEENATFRRDYLELEKILAENQDLYDQLAQRIGKGGHAPRAPQNPEIQNLSQGLQEVREMMRQQQQAAMARAQEAEDAKLREQLDQTMKNFLSERGYRPDAFMDDARDYVLRRIAAMKDPQFEDVPFILHEWWKRQEGLKQHWVSELRNGKQADARLPVTPGPTTGSVGAKVDTGALDDKTSETLERTLRERLGWSG